MGRDKCYTKASKTSFLWTFFLLYAWACVFSAAAQTHDSGISSLYSSYAYRLFLEEKYAEARALLEISEEYSAENSDALYMKGKLMYLERASVYDPLVYYIEALNIDNFFSFRKEDCIYDTVRLLLRLRLFPEALHFLVPLSERGVITEEFIVLKLRSLLGAEKNQEALSLGRRGITIYPQSEELLKFLLRNDEKTSRETTNKILSGHRDIIEDPELVLSLLAGIPDQELIQRILRIIPQPLKTAGLFMEELKTVPRIYYDDIDKYLNLEGGMKKENLILFNELLSDSALQGYLLWKLNDFTGDILYDSDIDGYPEERIVFVNGLPLEIMLDKNQDGLTEFHVLISEGVPKDVTVRHKGSIYQYFYGNYPEVTRSVIYTEKTMEILQITKGSLMFPLGQLDKSLFVTPYSPSFPEEPSRANLLRHALFTDTYEIGSYQYPAEKWEKLLDNSAQIASDLDKQGHYRAITIDREGIPQYTKRDFDGDGFYEVYELYREGKLVSRAFDGNGNGIPEYIVSFGNTVFEIWDFNEDWIPDCVSYIDLEGNRTVSYAPDLGGIFSTHIYYNNSIPIKVVRNGIEFQVFKQQGAMIFWIGQQPSGEIRVPPGFNGTFKTGDKHVFSFSWEGKQFLEVLD